MKNILLSITLETDNQTVPLYQQLADAIDEKITAGILKEGTMLPSTRKLAEQLHISRKTVVSAIEILMIKGKVVSKDRVGLLVTHPTTSKNTSLNNKRQEETQVPPQTIIVNDGFPDTQLLPFHEFSRSYRKLFNRAAQWHNLGYNNPMGYPKLRNYIAEILGKNRELSVESDELCIVRGAQMALFLIANAVLERGNHMAMENPGYHKAYETFTKAGMQVHTIPVDDHGIDVNLLEETCQKVDLKAIYITPRHQYPTTVKLSMERRKRLCHLSEKYGFIIIEDDFGAEFQFTGKHLLPLSSLLEKDRYIYIGTFSKIFAPGIRVGYVTSSFETIRKIAEYRSLIDIQGDAITERALCELYENGDMQRHIRKTARIYKNRLTYITKEIKNVLGNLVTYQKPHGGLAVWLKLNTSQNKKVLTEKFQKAGISIPLFTLSDGSIGLRIGYASMTNEITSELIASIYSIIK